MRTGFAACAALVMAIGGRPAAAQERPASVFDAVRQEATLPNAGPRGRPLPLVANWNSGGTGQGFTPDWQLAQLDANHALLPWFPLPEMGQKGFAHEAAFRRCAQLKLPIALISSQWERMLSADKRFLNLPPDQNPNVIGADGRPQPRVSPVGAVGPWREVGKAWGSHPVLARLIAIYPDPPLVLMISNNEHAKVSWPKVEEDKTWLDRHGPGKPDEFKRAAVAEGWIERYRAMLDAFRGELGPWAGVTKFVGYNAFGPETFARWAGWQNYSLHVPGRFSPWPSAWDGGSPSFYTNNWEQSTDYQVFSPQVASMNWVFMLKQVERQNPDFWFEMSVWDGYVPGKENSKRNWYRDRGMAYTPERYAGMATFGMWLTRPRLVREFRAYRETRAELEPFFQALIAAVDRVHHHPTLEEFWRFGRLVPNRDQQHPFSTIVPPEYAKEDRWFRLATDADPKGRWKLATELHTFALALELGKAPQRRWLVYAHTATGDREVTVKLPGRGDVKVSAPVGGAYTVVSEATGKASPLP